MLKEISVKDVQLTIVKQNWKKINALDLIIDACFS